MVCIFFCNRICISANNYSFRYCFCFKINETIFIKKSDFFKCRTEFVGYEFYHGVCASENDSDDTAGKKTSFEAVCAGAVIHHEVEEREDDTSVVFEDSDSDEDLTDELGYGNMFDDEDDEIDTTIPDEMDLVDDDFDDFELDDEE